MQLNRLLIRVVLFGITAILSMVACAECIAKPRPNISAEDKLQIVESVLQKESGRIKSHQEDGRIKLAKGNIPQGLAPKLDGIEIVLVDASEIKAKRETPTGISYFIFGKFEMKGSKIIVYFGYCRESRGDYGAEGSIYEYKRVASKWRGRLTGGFGAAN